MEAVDPTTIVPRCGSTGKAGCKENKTPFRWYWKVRSNCSSEIDPRGPVGVGDSIGPPESRSHASAAEVMHYSQRAGSS
jgi:hypothetical protein